MTVNQSPQVCLGIDFGTIRVGLAIARGPLSERYAIWPNDMHLLERISMVVQQEKVGQVVVGVSEGQMKELTERFVTQLQKVVTVPIAYQDETLTSHQVGGWLQQQGRRRKFAQIDDLAAAEILQNWLDEKEDGRV